MDFLDHKNNILTIQQIYIVIVIAFIIISTNIVFFFLNFKLVEKYIQIHFHYIKYDIKVLT